MKKLLTVLILFLLAMNNAFAKVSIEGSSCGDDMFSSVLEIYFQTTDFERFWYHFTTALQSPSNTKYVNDLKKLSASIKRPEGQANKLKDAWLTKTYTLSDSSSFYPKIGPVNNKAFLQWASGPNSELSFCTVFIQIYGEIEKDDVNAFRKAIDGFANPPYLHVQLDSRGGNVEAGIEIGNIIRKHYGSTSISGKSGNQAVCYSACALIYAGGIARLPELGNLGVHQHFFSETNLSSMSVEEGIVTMRKATKRISQYLDGLGVNQNFLQLALATNADDIHLISKREHQILLPHAVIEYANVIPKKKEEHLKAAIKIFSRAILDAARRVNKDADLRQILEIAYVKMSEEKEDFRWANFEDYYLVNGKYYQTL